MKKTENHGGGVEGQENKKIFGPGDGNSVFPIKIDMPPDHFMIF